MIETNKMIEIKSLAALGRALRDDVRAMPGLLPGRFDSFTWIAAVLALVGSVILGAAPALLKPLRVPPLALAAVAALYIAGVGLIFVIRMAFDSRAILAAIGAGLAIAVGLSFTFAPDLGGVVFDLLAAFVVLRLPARWSAPLTVLIAALVAVLAAERDLSTHHTGSTLADLGWALGSIILIAGIAASQRLRLLAIQRLQATQARLQAEMARNAELAVAQERARIARDMHDVLAHSLTVLSIQLQAARQLVVRDPERVARMLDDMAAGVRESLVESRRVVGMLREAAHAAREDTPAARLRAVMERFGDRSDVQCSLSETGEARALSDAQISTLQFALQEALTNAFRHGSARHVWASLVWDADAVTLVARDDGCATPQPDRAVEGGYGLRGMFERATALGGTLAAGPQEEGGFALSLRLPLAVAPTGVTV